MPLHESLTTATIKALFSEEITAAGGTVSDTFEDGTRLFTRSILPHVREVQRADQVQGGVALRASEREVWVHPYVFRLVCRNGAIMAQAVQTRQVETPEFATDEEASTAVRSAIQACCAEDAFTVAAEEMRSAREREADVALNLLPLLSHLPSEAGAQILRTIMERFFQEGDRSRFALMNAVTSVARDTPDPEVRWRLEELGGGIPAGRLPVPQLDDSAAEMALVGYPRRVGRRKVCL
jgi:hypothetical protein